MMRKKEKKREGELVSEDVFVKNAITCAVGRMKERHQRDDVVRMRARRELMHAGPLQLQLEEQSINCYTNE